MQWIGRGRYMLPAHALGACERLVEMGIEQANNRVTFGEPIANRQAIQWMIADSAVEIEALRWLVLTAAWQVDQGLDSRQAQSIAKLYGGLKANEMPVVSVSIAEEEVGGIGGELERVRALRPRLRSWWDLDEADLVDLLPKIAPDPAQGQALTALERLEEDLGRRGLFGSFTQVGSSAGMLLATGAFSLVKLATTDEQFAAFGWRLPFLASGLLVVVGLAIRLGVEDSAEFRVHRDAGTVSRAPVVELLRHHARPVLVTAGLRLGQAVGMLTFRVLRRPVTPQLGVGLLDDGVHGLDHPGHVLVGERGVRARV